MAERMKRCLASILAWIALAALAAAPVFAQDTMGLWIDPDGSTYIKNLSATKTFVIDGYTISAESNDLIPMDYDGTKGWKAFEDILTQFPEEMSLLQQQFGGAAVSMGSASPAGGNLTELTLNPSGLSFSPGEQWFIGKPFTINPFGPGGLPLTNYRFQYKTVDSLSQVVGVIVPEPSTLVLATLAGLGLVAMRWRRR